MHVSQGQKLLIRGLYRVLIKGLPGSVFGVLTRTLWDLRIGSDSLSESLPT